MNKEGYTKNFISLNCFSKKDSFLPNGDTSERIMPLILILFGKLSMKYSRFFLNKRVLFV